MFPHVTSVIPSLVRAGRPQEGGEASRGTNLPFCSDLLRFFRTAAADSEALSHLNSVGNNGAAEPPPIDRLSYGAGLPGSAITSLRAGSPPSCLSAFLPPCLDTVLPILARMASTPDP